MAKNKLNRDVAEILEPLDTNKKILSYLIVRNCTKNHNKAYIFVVLQHRKKPTHLVRFWTKFDEYSKMNEIWGSYSQKVHQRLLNAKAKEGYKIPSDDEYIKHKKIYRAIAEAVAIGIGHK